MVVDDGGGGLLLLLLLLSVAVVVVVSLISYRVVSNSSCSGVNVARMIR